MNNDVYYQDNLGNYYQLQPTNNTPPLKEIDSKSFGVVKAIGVGLIILGLAALTFISVVVLGGLAVPVSPIIFCMIAIGGFASLLIGSDCLENGGREIQPKKMEHQQPTMYLYTAQ